MLYIEQPDSLAHVYGPNSETVLNVVQELDNVTQYLLVGKPKALPFHFSDIYRECQVAPSDGNCQKQVLANCQK